MIEDVKVSRDRNEKPIQFYTEDNIRVWKCYICNQWHEGEIYQCPIKKIAKGKTIGWNEDDFKKELKKRLYKNPITPRK